MHVTVGSGVLSVNSSGTDVILARFPDAGKDLNAFDLTPSKIKTLAIPNDLKEWPTTALNGCTALERITTFGEETDFSLYQIKNLVTQCTALKHFQMPSTAVTGYTTFATPNFPDSIQSIVFSKNIVSFGNAELMTCANLSTLDFSKCTKLNIIGDTLIANNTNLITIDLSHCLNLQLIKFHAFVGCSNLTVVIFPSSEFQTISNNVTPPFNRTPVNTVIWKGRSTRFSGLDPYTFSPTKTLDELVNEGTITEIFVP